MGELPQEVVGVPVVVSGGQDEGGRQPVKQLCGLMAAVPAQAGEEVHVGVVVDTGSEASPCDWTPEDWGMRFQRKQCHVGSQYSERYSEEFKWDAIALARSSSKTITEVARDLGVSPESLRGWVKRARIDRGEDKTGELTIAEREELRQLRRQNIEQQKTIEILKKGVPRTRKAA
ncbi:transposase [Streptomyces sp. NPDC059679]|uniref:transposase n=1 Tax=Streptomyces sp. NPDC059679 TaxID=3346903 RepID=UPI0036CADB16